MLGCQGQVSLFLGVTKCLTIWWTIIDKWPKKWKSANCNVVDSSSNQKARTTVRPDIKTMELRTKMKTLRKTKREVAEIKNTMAEIIISVAFFQMWSNISGVEFLRRILWSGWNLHQSFSNTQVRPKGLFKVFFPLNYDYSSFSVALGGTAEQFISPFESLFEFEGQFFDSTTGR